MLVSMEQYTFRGFSHLWVEERDWGIDDADGRIEGVNLELLTFLALYDSGKYKLEVLWMQFG